MTTFQQMNAQLVETEDSFVVVDEYGETWDVFADAMDFTRAVQRDGQTAIFVRDRDSDLGTLTVAAEGDTYDLSCRDEFIVRRVDNAGSLEWTENTEG
jgi:hypothetical protein